MASSTLGSITRKTFSRVNTSVSITVASFMTKLLSTYMSRSGLILVGIVLFVVVGIFKRVGFVAHILVTVQSVLGIVVTTTIMKTIHGAPLQTEQYHLPAFILGTCFLLLVGVMPKTFRDTDEGTAVYMGVQYAYSDIVLATFVDPVIRRVLSFMFIIVMPLVLLHIHHRQEQPGPWTTLVAAMTYTGISFIMDTTMPGVTNSQGEDIVRGFASVLLVNVILGSVPSIGKDVGQFATWLIARRFSTMFEKYDILLSVSIAIMAIGIIKTTQKYIGGTVMGILNDLFILVTVFLTAGWVISSTDRGTNNSGDTLVLMVCIMSIARKITAFVSS